jgi:uncharacterized damage-inducible protein DinB
MSLLAYFQMLARYNRLANERLYESCSQLDPLEYRRQRQGSFGSIYALLNHILRGDCIWMARFQERSQSIPPLSAILFEDFADLRSARIRKDQEMEAFFEGVAADFLDRSFHYVDGKGQEHQEQVLVAVSHMFNHQTHHRGQIHVMLSQTAVPPPSLDLLRIINPA